MTVVKDKKDIDILRLAGEKLSGVMEELKKEVVVGATSDKLNSLAERLIKESGSKSAFLGYTPEGASRPYPATLNVSINNEIVHGIPNEKDKVFKEGDIVGLDVGLSFKGWFVDMAETVAVGEVDKRAKELLNTTLEALFRGIKAAKVGNRIGDISHAIETYAKPYGYGIIDELGGHSLGRSIHEEPFVPNVGRASSGPILEEGLVLAIEPMLTEGSKDIILDSDGYTFKTKDGSRSAQFEHTILITKGGPEILTQSKKLPKSVKI